MWTFTQLSLKFRVANSGGKYDSFRHFVLIFFIFKALEWDVTHQFQATSSLVMDKLSAENKDEDELSIPRAALNKMIKELIPNIRVANDARELILNCCTEFIHLVSSEANEICNKQSKKTISPEHIIAGKCWPSNYSEIWLSSDIYEVYSCAASCIEELSW